MLFLGLILITKEGFHNPITELIEKVKKVEALGIQNEEILNKVRCLANSKEINNIETICSQTKEIAKQLLIESANLGDLSALEILAKQSLKGLNKEDFDEAVLWYEKATSFGYCMLKMALVKNEWVNMIK